jgi:glycerophosphoryl diester phosphodiesterase
MAAPGHPYLDWPAPIPIAHRGGTAEYPENTLPAFEHAVSLGYRYLETDVHLTADGVLVAFHDTNLLRTCGVDAEIADLTWAEIEPLLVEGVAPIPRMRDLFDRFPDARFNIDAKSDRAVDPLTELVEEIDAVDRVCLASFSLRRLWRMRRSVGQRLVTNLSMVEVACLALLGWLPGRGQRLAQVPPHVGRFDLVTGRFLRHAHRRRIPVHVWTINHRDEMNGLLDLGVDGMMTDETSTMREVFVERGLWIDGPPA